MHFEQSYYVSIIKRHFPQSFVDAAVLEVGSYDVNGTIREFFERCEYTGLDLMPGPGVDVVSSGHEYSTYKRFDTVVSCECFEHNPYYLETFENMVSATCGGGLVIFTCATEGRPEHGTTRTTPESSPGTVSTGWEYYLNLTEENFSTFDFHNNFAGYRFMVNPGSQDLYFIGVKYPAPEDIEDRLNSIAEEVDALIDASVKLARYDTLLQAPNESAAEEFLNSFVSSLSPALEAHARYRQTWSLISKKRYQQADLLLNRIFSLCKRSELGVRPEYHYQHSQYLHETGKPAEAMAAARAAIEKAPFYAEYWEHLARLMLNVGDAQGAEQALIEAGRLSTLDAALQNRVNEMNFRKKNEGDNQLSIYEISISSLSSSGLDSKIRMWNLDSPIAGTLEATKARELTVSGWVLLQDDRDSMSMLLKVGSAVKAYGMNVVRPDVVAAILQLPPAVHPQLMCGFSFSVPITTTFFSLGFRVAGQDYWGREIQLVKQPHLLAGKDHWEFPADTACGILELRGKSAAFEHQNVLAWKKRFYENKTKLNRAHLVLITPHKAAVYPDFLPAGTSLAFQRPVYDILSQNSGLVYPLERLISSSMRCPIYPKSSAMWTAYGAYVSYRALMDKTGYSGLKKEVVEESRIVWGAEGIEPVFERKARLSFQNGLIGQGQIKHYVNSDGDLPKMLIFCNAFGMTHFDLFLAESCTELLCIHSPDIDTDLIERFSPDIVISQYSEDELALPPVETASLFNVIKAGIDNGVYPVAKLEQFVSFGAGLNAILNEQQSAELIHEAQKSLV